MLWQQQRLFELWRLWDAEIRKIRPDARVHRQFRRRRAQRPGHEDGGGIGAHAVRRPPSRSGVMAPWANGKNGKEYRATLGSKAIGGIFTWES